MVSKERQREYKWESDGVKATPRELVRRHSDVFFSSEIFVSEDPEYRRISR